ncbi:DNA primase [Desulfococcus sp.]|uniref:DNA primase n=1 Tax=Desulfococcus sp. TaxID=2025834 RepID=UPI0035947618
MESIPEKTISDIRNVSDIVNVISEVVLLRKAGKNFQGLCPFHSEKTPSFSVSPDKQVFYCFGCGAGGNVFTFLMKHEGLSFAEAVRKLGRRHGIAVEDRQLSPEERHRMQEREGIFDVNREAAAFFRKNLTDGQEGRSALAYLLNRGLTRETIDRFSLGYAPPAWDSLSGYFSGRQISSDFLEKAGLVIPREKGGGHYDRFRNRIVFPILDASSHIVGFGGRVMDDALPKYLNSPETAVFNKRRSLYGLDAARARCRETGTVYVVEGYFDVLALSQAGIRNAVATLGTALSTEHVRILKGYAREIVLVYDSDQAGMRAAVKSVETFRKENMNARILVLPEGDDPDSFLLRFGPGAFMEKARTARTMMDFLMEETVREHGLSIEGKLRIIQDLKAPLGAISDPMARSLYVRNLAAIIDVDERSVAGAVAAASSSGMADAAPGRGPVPEAAGIAGRSVMIERKIITMMLQFKDFLVEIDRRGTLDDFEDERLKSIGMHLLAHYRASGEHDIAGLIEKLNDAEREMTVNLSLGGDVWDRDGCLRLLAQFDSGRKRHTDDLLQRIDAASRGNDQALLLELLKEKQNRARKRQAIN